MEVDAEAAAGVWSGAGIVVVCDVEAAGTAATWAGGGESWRCTVCSHSICPCMNAAVSGN